MFDAGIVAHIALLGGIGFAPLPGGLAEQGDIEQIGLVGVSETGLLLGNRGRNQVLLDGVCVDAVVELGKRAVQLHSSDRRRFSSSLRRWNSLMR